MKRFRSTQLILAAALGACLPLVAADQGSGSSQQQSNSAQQSSGQQASGQNQQKQTVTGKIVELSTVQPQGQQDKHMLAQIQSSDGQKQWVDLGTQQKIEQSGKSDQIKKGQSIQVSGTQGQINGRHVLKAQSISEPGGTVIVTITELTPVAMVTIPQTVTGKITSLKEPSSGSNQNMRAEVQTDQGEKVTLDLGSGKEVQQDLKLQQGEWISARGIMADVGGKPLFIVTDVADIAKIQPQSGQASPAGAKMGDSSPSQSQGSSSQGQSSQKQSSGGQQSGSNQQQPPQ